MCTFDEGLSFMYHILMCSCSMLAVKAYDSPDMSKQKRSQDKDRNNFKRETRNYFNSHTSNPPIPGDFHAESGGHPHQLSPPDSSHSPPIALHLLPSQNPQPLGSIIVRQSLPSKFNNDRCLQHPDQPVFNCPPRQDVYLSKQTVPETFPEQEEYAGNQQRQKDYHGRDPAPRRKEFSRRHRSSFRNKNTPSQGPLPTHEQLSSNSAVKHHERNNLAPHPKRSETRAESRPVKFDRADKLGQKSTGDHYQMDRSQLLSVNSNTSETSRKSQQCCQKKKPPLNSDSKDLLNTQGESSKISDTLPVSPSTEKQDCKRKTRFKGHKPHNHSGNLPGVISGNKAKREGSEIMQDFKQQMPSKVQFKRSLSNASSLERDKSSASEVSARQNGSERENNKGQKVYHRNRWFMQNDKGKFRSKPDLKLRGPENFSKSCSFEETEGRIAVDSLTSTSSVVSGDVKGIDRMQIKYTEYKEAHVRSKKAVVNFTQKDPDTSQVSSEMVSLFHKTKASLHVWKSFKGAASLKETINQNMDTSEKFSIHFVDDSIICSSRQGICTVIVSTSSRQLGNHLIKSLYANLRKNLKTKVEFHICGIEDDKKVKENNSTTKDAHVKKDNSTTKGTSPKTIQKRAQKMTHSVGLKGKKQEMKKGTFSDTVERNHISYESEPTIGPAIISLAVDKILPKKEDFFELLSRILKNKASSYKPVPDSFAVDTSKTSCKFEASSKSAATDIVKQLQSRRLEGVRINCFIVNGELNPHINHSSEAVNMQTEILKAIDEITKKTHKTLRMHQKKKEACEHALKLMKSATDSENDEDGDHIEELVLTDKLKEVMNQQDTFLSRRDELIEKVRKIEPTNFKKDLSDLLQSAGVECERLVAALPIYARREDIVKKISENQVSVILGETGSGKSTQMAQYIYDAGLAGQGLIVCTEPRKVAAITLAERVAKETAGKVGNLVGFKTGLKKSMSAMTKIVFTTDHSLLNECLVDRNLSRYTCIIVDEAHERSIYTDLLLGMIKACLSNRPDLKVIITSATIDPEIFIRYFKSSPELQVSGRSFPVDVVYSEMDNTQEFENFEMKAVLKAVDVHKSEEPGDILVFLTSSVEIMRCIEEFEKLMTGRNDFKCFPLHGQLPPDEQRRVFQRLPQGIRKVVFATNCAETSITIDGIKYVIDIGVAKEMRYDSKRNICMLGTYVISKSSANQRKGRAGRTGSGKCFRLYSEKGYRKMENSSEPEILKVPLGQSVLKLAELGVDVKTYDFVQPPSVEAIDSSLNTLRDLGALSSEGITDIGRWISKLPFHPKEGFLVYHGNKKNLLYDSIVLASLIANGSNLFYKGLTESEAQTAARSKSQYGSEYGDIFTWLEVYKAWIQIPVIKQSKWCQENGINYRVMNFTKQCVKEVAMVLNNELGVHLEYNFASDESAAVSLRKIIFDANVASVCHYLGHVRAGFNAVVSERQVHLHPSSTLLSHKSQPEWIVYTEFTRTSRDFIKGITVVKEEWVMEAVSEGKLRIDIGLAKQFKIELVHREIVGSSVFRKLVGRRYSHLRVWENEMENVGMKTVVVEVDSNLGMLDIFSTSPMNQAIAECINAAKEEAIEILKSDEAEIAVSQKTGTEPSGVRVVLGHGGCVKTLLMPDQSNKVLIKNSCYDTTEEDIRAKFGAFGNIKECVWFRRLDPWGFIRYSTFTEAQAAVHRTRNDVKNFAVLKIDNQFNRMVSRFEARLSWCQRPIKGTGTAFIKCPPIEKASLLGRCILLPNGRCELKISNQGGDLVCFNTGSAQEKDIKKKVMGIVGHDESSKHKIQVTIAREEAKSDLIKIKNNLSKILSCHVAREKFDLLLLPTPKQEVNQVASIKFESPTDGFKACSKLQGRLQVGGQPVEIHLSLKTTLHVPASIMNVCKSRFDEIFRTLKKHKKTQVCKRQPRHGDFTLDIESERAKVMVEARELLQKELDGEIIDCRANDLVRRLIRRQGKEVLREIESMFDVLIVVNDHKESVHIYGTTANVSSAQVEINKYLDKLAEGLQVDVNLKGPGRPPGLMKELMKKYGSLHDDLIQQFGLSDVIIDFRQQKLSIFGPPECVDRALSNISELESSLLQSHVTCRKKWMPDCVVCMCPVENISEVYHLEACGHSYCLTCLKQQISVSVQDKIFPVVCAEESCGMPLVWKDFYFCLQERWTSEEQLADNSVSAFVAANPDKYRFCLTLECPVVYEVTKNEEGFEFNCPSCFISVCTSCHTAYHSGLTCNMSTIEQEAEQQLQKWVMENPEQRKICPWCCVGVEKTKGCNKIHCTSCHTYFCWLCLEISENRQKCYAHLAEVHGGFL